ncbi:MAG: molybdopterin molybdotransferase MoeA [Gammaproteobacteria bacterium]|nr:molybdopterin molybdotransferase MoeA [Gammaproteobacteria bacterium]
MLSEHEAIKTLLAHAKLLAEKEIITIAEANGRVNAEKISAPINIPTNDNSAMDGFACNSANIQENTAINISQRIAAGDNPPPLTHGTAARIFTGASLPPGADCIIIQEDCDYNEHTVSMHVRPTAGRHVRYAGEDIRQDDIILNPGDTIGPAQVGLIASLGVDKVCVYKKLRVALLTTGSELLEPGTRNESGKRYNSNRYTLTAAINQLNIEVAHHRIVADTLSDTKKALISKSQDADIVISTGGVSVGDEDHVKTALESTGTMHFWKIAMKPGKPLAFGTINGTPFIGLPGNPVSALVTFLIIARPFLLACQGLTPRPLIKYSVTSGFDWSTQQRCEYLRVKLIEADEQLIAHRYQSQDSGIQTSLHHSDGLIRIETNSHIKIGDTVSYIPYSALFTAIS